MGHIDSTVGLPADSTAAQEADRNISDMLLIRKAIEAANNIAEGVGRMHRLVEPVLGARVLTHLNDYGRTGLIVRPSRTEHRQLL